jgi:hypothetical protein
MGKHLLRLLDAYSLFVEEAENRNFEQPGFPILGNDGLTWTIIESRWQLWKWAWRECA